MTFMRHEIQYVLFIKVQSGMYHQRPRTNIHKLTPLRYHPKQYLKSFGICASFRVFFGVKSLRPSKTVSKFDFFCQIKSWIGVPFGSHGMCVFYET